MKAGQDPISRSMKRAVTPHKNRPNKKGLQNAQLSIIPISPVKFRKKRARVLWDGMLYILYRICNQQYSYLAASKALVVENKTIFLTCQLNKLLKYSNRFTNARSKVTC